MIPENEPFHVTIKLDRKEYRLKVMCTYRDKLKEQYTAFYGFHKLIFECNWPVFRNRGLKHRMPTWKLVEGKLTYRSSFKLIVQAIEVFANKKP